MNHAQVSRSRPSDQDRAGSNRFALLTETETKKPDTSFTCQLCFQPYKDPRMLLCLHSFCQECIHRQVDSLGVQLSDTQESCSMQCPTCTKTTSIPVGGVSNLPQDLHLDFETKCAQFQFKISQKSGLASCDVCIDSRFGPALGFCSTCIQFLCKVCCDYHKHARHLYQHKIFPLGKDVTKEELMETIKPSEPSCALHDQSRLRFYCETCDFMICRDCTVVVHKDHKCVELSSIAQSYRNEIKDILGSAQKVEQKLVRAIDGNMKALEESQASEKFVSQTIKDSFMQLRKALDDRMNQLLGDVHSITVSRMAALGLQRERFEGFKRDISHFSDFSSHVVQVYTDHEVMALKKLPLKELQAAIDRTEKMSLLPCSSSRLQFILQTSVEIKAISNLGYVDDFGICPAKSKWIKTSLAVINTPCQLKVEALNFSAQKYFMHNLQVAATIQPTIVQHNKSLPYQAVEGKVENHKDGTYTITLTPLIAGPHKLLITIDGQNIKNIPYNLEVRSSKPNYRNFHHPQQISLSNVKSPLSIAIHESGDVFISSESNCVYIFDQTGFQKSIIGSKGNGPAQFNTPSGLAIKDDVLYIADSNNHRIQKLTLGGDFITMFGKLGSSQGEFNCPCALIIDCNDRLIVADRGNFRIQVMNLDGTFISYICGEHSGGFQHISGLAGLDPAGNVLVVHSSTIDAFSLDGKRAKTYKCGQYGQPIIGTTDYNGYMLLATPTTLVVHDPNGKVFHKEHTAYVPTGIALHPNDCSAYIVIANAHNVGVNPYYDSENNVYSVSSHSTVEKSAALLKYSF